MPQSNTIRKEQNRKRQGTMLSPTIIYGFSVVLIKPSLNSSAERQFLFDTPRGTQQIHLQAIKDGLKVHPSKQVSNQNQKKKDIGWSNSFRISANQIRAD